MQNRMNLSKKPEEKEYRDKEMQINLEFAKETYRETGKFMPMVIGLSNTGRFVVPFHWIDDNEKYKLADAIKKKFKDLGVIAIIFMTEAWSLKIKHPALYTEETLRPSQHPDRIEVFIMNYTDKKGTKGLVMPIIREGNEVTLGTPVLNEEGVSMVDNLFGNYFSRE
jgi:hypothetical protein